MTGGSAIGAENPHTDAGFFVGGLGAGREIPAAHEASGLLLFEFAGQDAGADDADGFEDAELFPEHAPQGITDAVGVFGVFAAFALGLDQNQKFGGGMKPLRVGQDGNLAAAQLDQIFNRIVGAKVQSGVGLGRHKSHGGHDGFLAATDGIAFFAIGDKVGDLAVGAFQAPPKLGLAGNDAVELVFEIVVVLDTKAGHFLGQIGDLGFEPG